ncbi:MAG TPA: VOC family protein [Gemmatimonadaceae bacterium]|nr:VOC family protein [Gemmatimonadaceae bacterium]
MTITSLHHITLISSDAQRTVDYYTTVLGLRLIKQTVSFDDPTKRHFFLGNAAGAPGSIVSFFEWPGAAPGREGVGGTHHFALLVETRDALLKWKRRLTDYGVTVNGPLDRHYFESIYHRDPDGAVIEIATRGAGWTRDEEPDRIGTEHRPPPPEMVKGNRDQDRIRADTWPDPVPEVSPDMSFAHLHHITAIGEDIERTHAFLNGILGLRRVKRTSNFDMPDSYHWYWGSGDGAPGTVVTYFERKGAARVTHGPGQTDHYALAVDGEESLHEWRARMLEAGLRVSEVIDRLYYRSIYTSDPDGQAVELATRSPGFTIDEAETELGEHLQLPPWIESGRGELERRFTPLLSSRRSPR